MSRYKMHAIEYNLLMTLLKLLNDRLPQLQIHNVGDIHVNPAYPRDITNMFKPSIIVRRVDTTQYKSGFGNFIGQIFDGDKYSDVSGICHDIMTQFDVVADGNIQCTLLTSVLCEDIFNDIIINNHGRFQLYDFTADENNPSNMGAVTIASVPDVTYIPDGISRPNLNNDYISAVRLTFTIVQEIIPNQEYVDLSKWMKIKQTIHVKTI